MRKADRLFQIIQILRRTMKPVTASELADELEVSRRTVYRDIAHLVGQRVPVQGEAGFGYILSDGFDMPPLMFTPEELEAVVLGLELAKRLGDPFLGHAAADVMAKIKAVTPPTLLPYIEQPAVGVKPDEGKGDLHPDSRSIRMAIREGKKLQIDYHPEKGAATRRVVWPVLLGYADTHGLLIAWCESRQDFRHFRTDRILEVEVLDEAIGVSKQKLRRQWQTWRQARLAKFPNSR